MKKLILFLNFFLILFLVCNCSRVEKQTSSGKEIYISDMISKNNELIIKKFRYVMLETNQDCLIGEVDKVIFKKRFYVMDKKITKTVFVFDSEGKFLFKIAKKGKGPGEYLYLNDVDVDEFGNIYLLDIGGRKILTYNDQGKFISGTKFKIWTDSFGFLEDELFILNQEDRTDNKYNIIYFEKGKIKFNYFKYRKSIDEQGSIRTVKNRILRSDNLLLYSPKYTYSLYEITSTGINERYKIGFNKNLQIPLKKLEKIPLKDQIKFLFEQNFIWNIDKYFETKEMLCFSVMYQKKEWTILYSKATEKYKIFTCLPCLAEFNNVLGNLSPIGITDSSFISNVSINQLLFLKKDTTSQLYNKNKSFINSVTANSNPIFLIFELNYF